MLRFRRGVACITLTGRGQGGERPEREPVVAPFATGVETPLIHDSHGGRKAEWRLRDVQGAPSTGRDIGIVATFDKRGRQEVASA